MCEPFIVTAPQHTTMKGSARQFVAYQEGRVLISMPHTAVPIPTALIIEQHTRPLVLGIYTLMSRLVRYHKQPIMLAQEDIVAYDTTIVRGSVIRAFKHLQDNQWILRGARAPGTKTAYLPTWGFVAGTTLPWDFTDETVPAGVATIMIPSQVLDDSIGVIVPRETGQALIDRLHATPVLHLRDIGVYLTTLVGYLGSTENLLRQGLIVDPTAMSG